MFGVRPGQTKVSVFSRTMKPFVPITNNQTSRDSHIMALLRPLVLACLRFNINFAARHMPGRINTLVDKLSCLQVDEFRQLAPWEKVNPVEVPYSVSPAGLDNL